MPHLHHFLLLLLLTAATTTSQPVLPSRCGAERCGALLLPYPFHLNSSCAATSDAFRLSCDSNSSLHLSLPNAATFRVLAFLPSGSLLLDYSPSSTSPCDAGYAPFARPSSPAAALDASPYFAVTAANVLRLYDCEDSSLCRVGCDAITSGCAGGGGGGNRTGFGCCYLLSDGSVWKAGDGLGVFAGFGCRGFSSWVKNRSVDAAAAVGVVRAIEVEWAVPWGSAMAKCADGGVAINATTVRGGMRCACAAGLVGDGFALGAGCSKDCNNDDQAADARDCCHGRFCSKKAVALAGLFVSMFFVTAAVTFWYFLRQPSKERKWDVEPACIPKILGKACNARQFTYEQLDEAKKRFDGERAVDLADGTVHTGVLDDGCIVAVQKVSCETQETLRQVLERMELLSQISHRNVARVVGFCFESSTALLVVHEHFVGGTLEDHLRQIRGLVLSWYHRVNIAIELAGVLTYLQSQLAAPIFLHDLKSSEVYLDTDYTAKVAGYKLIRSGLANGSPSITSYAASYDSDVVCNFGHLLTELLTGLKHQHVFDTVAPKVREGRLHEIVDPTLLSGKQLPASHEEVSRVFEVAVRCLSSTENGLCMPGVAKELMHIVRDNIGSSSRIEISLEDTFSNSSLLQMISMSPESLHLQLP